MSSLHLLVDARCDICRYELCMLRFQINGNALRNGRARAWIQRTVGWPLEIRECSFAVQFFLCIFFFHSLSPSNSGCCASASIPIQTQIITSNGIFLPFFFSFLISSLFRSRPIEFYRVFYTFPVHYSWCGRAAMPRTNGEWMPRALTRMHWTALWVQLPPPPLCGKYAALEHT